MPGQSDRQILYGSHAGGDRADVGMASMSRTEAKRPSDGLSRGDLVIAVSANHIGANELAVRMTDVSLRRMLDAGITGRALYDRITDSGRMDVVKLLDDEAQVLDA